MKVVWKVKADGHRRPGTIEMVEDSLAKVWIARGDVDPASDVPAPQEKDPGDEYQDQDNDPEDHVDVEVMDASLSDSDMTTSEVVGKRTKPKVARRRGGK